MRKLKKTSASGWLALLWVVCFAFSSAACWFQYVRSAVSMENFQSIFAQLTNLYSPYLGVILAYYFGSRIRVNPNAECDRIAFALACTTSALWNIFVLAIISQTLSLSIPVENASEILAGVVPKISWLVAPAIGYYFGKTAEVSAN